MPWRVFPWDPAAKPGEPFSSSYVFPNQGSGRFDIAGKQIIYLAESAVHAVAEKLQRFRGQRIDRRDLMESRHPLALAECRIDPDILEQVADLCDPRTLVKHEIAPDVIASRQTSRTQAVAMAIYSKGYKGLRWWSAMSGDWHTLVLFLDKVPAVEYGKPEPLSLTHQVVEEACVILGVSL